MRRLWKADALLLSGLLEPSRAFTAGPVVADADGQRLVPVRVELARADCCG